MIDRRSEYLKRKNTPTPFNQGPEMQNYNRMMDLQNQASEFKKNDPRIQEHKEYRCQSAHIQGVKDRNKEREGWDIHSDPRFRKEEANLIHRRSRPCKTDQEKVHRLQGPIR